MPYVSAPSDVARVHAAKRLAALATWPVVFRAVRRFGGVTGDVFGAATELALAALRAALS